MGIECLGGKYWKRWCRKDILERAEHGLFADHKEVPAYFQLSKRAIVLTDSCLKPA